ncbi:MAG: hypothetical protein U9N45_03875 [Gemmatimonadota bacterium]|nr:hypothetical protein [Gemmatimonadota bacterium]
MRKLAEKGTDRLAGLVKRHLGRLEKYGKLIREQGQMIEEEDYDGMGRILEKKDKILSRSREEIGDLSSLTKLAAESEEAEMENAEKLLSRLTARLELFAGLEAECQKKALAVKENIAGQLSALRKGKKLMREYTRFPGDSRARFKDIRT